MFQYRKRYEVTCDRAPPSDKGGRRQFQYRKRYEVTCDSYASGVNGAVVGFQYRKRYEVTCDEVRQYLIRALLRVSIPQAV